MGQLDNLQVAVKLRETDWIAILGVLEPVCRTRGGDWLSWGEYVKAQITTQCQLAAVLPSPPFRGPTRGQHPEEWQDDLWAGSCHEGEGFWSDYDGRHVSFDELGDIRDDGTPYGWDPLE